MTLPTQLRLYCSADSFSLLVEVMVAALTTCTLRLGRCEYLQPTRLTLCECWTLSCTVVLVEKVEPGHVPRIPVDSFHQGTPPLVLNSCLSSHDQDYKYAAALPHVRPHVLMLQTEQLVQQTEQKHIP